ncbi:hypothetical protein ACF0H5_018302 [Mactra antiquata]
MTPVVDKCHVVKKQNNKDTPKRPTKLATVKADIHKRQNSAKESFRVSSDILLPQNITSRPCPLNELFTVAGYRYLIETTAVGHV